VLGSITVFLMLAGNNMAFTALRSIIIALGLPSTILVCVMCISIKRIMDNELHPETNDDLSVSEGRYKAVLNDNSILWSYSMFHPLHIFDIILARRGEMEDHASWKIYLLSTLAPWYVAGLVAGHMWKEGTHKDDDSYSMPLFTTTFHSREQRMAQMLMVASSVCFYTAMILALAGLTVTNMASVAFTLYLACVVPLALLRASIRNLYKINSHPLEDLLACALCYPFALAQMYNEIFHRQQLYETLLSSDVDSHNNWQLEQQRTQQELKKVQQLREQSHPSSPSDVTTDSDHNELVPSAGHPQLWQQQVQRHIDRRQEQTRAQSEHGIESREMDIEDRGRSPVLKAPATDSGKWNYPQVRQQQAHQHIGKLQVFNEHVRMQPENDIESHELDGKRVGIQTPTNPRSAEVPITGITGISPVLKSEVQGQENWEAVMTDQRHTAVVAAASHTSRTLLYSNTDTRAARHRATRARRPSL
jgi:Cys-rich protein (TIGR01571 family)